jgi:signal transduction histidine kinase
MPPRSKPARSNSNFAPIDLNALIHEICEPLEPLAQEKGITLAQELSAALPPVRADRAKLRRVIVNLLSNALKFTPKGGRVAVRGERAGDDAVLVAIADTGVGIAAEDLPHLFDKYEQARSRSARDEKGTASASTSHANSSKLHGGEIHVESEEGKGSTFSFTFRL